MEAPNLRWHRNLEGPPEKRSEKTRNGVSAKTLFVQIQSLANEEHVLLDVWRCNVIQDMPLSPCKQRGGQAQLSIQCIYIYML